MEANVKAIDLLKLELEEIKKRELLAVIFFDGEHREKINYYKKKRKECEKLIEKLLKGEE